MDKEKVINALENALEKKKNLRFASANMSFEFIEVLLAMLKEQEETIGNLNETVKNLLQQITDIKEYMTPIGKVKDVKAYAELLKEQEAVKPIKSDNPEESEYCCGICGYPLWLDELYCAHCGRRIEWEGR